MTRIASLFVATTLAILPLSAFAQTSTTAPATVPPGKATAATMTDAKAPVSPKKAELHSLNNHHQKNAAPAKSAEPTKS